MDSDIRVLEKENVMRSLKPKPLRLRKRGGSSLRPPSLHEVDPNSRPTAASCPVPKLPRNPFRCKEVKRKYEEDEDSLLWHHTHRTLDIVTPSISLDVPSFLDECAQPAFDFPQQVQPVPPSPSLCVDWSLKSRVRFTSPAPFPNRGSYKTFEEVNGTIGYVRCLHPSDKDVHSGVGALLFQHSLVWMHPNLPWLQLFPRPNRQNGPPALPPSAQEILHSKWCDSFRSLYQLVRLYQCPFFYLCAPAFTVLFRCAGAASVPVLHALITPTTVGLRNALKEEGITFSMPLCKDTEEISDDEVEEDASWLESLGLSQEDFPSLRKKRRCGQLRMDHRPESLVWVEDSETQALVNFLLCSPFCTDRTGPMTGVPPTLLAPVAFLGGTLQSLQMRHGKVKQGELDLESMELSGPLLPSAVHTLCSLLSSTQQEAGFTATLTSHEPTESFTQVASPSPPLPSIFAQNNLADCGLASNFVHQMCSLPTHGPVHHLRAEAGLFTTT